jgi:hypothetical protein
MPLADFSLYVLADAPATAATLNRSPVDIGRPAFKIAPPPESLVTDLL